MAIQLKVFPSDGTLKMVACPHVGREIISQHMANVLHLAGIQIFVVCK